MKIVCLITLVIVTNIGKIFASENDLQVFVCLGEYAKVYHSRLECSGLNNCKAKIATTTNIYASVNMRRRPCCICWSNVYSGCDTDPNDNIVKFNPYVSQIPSIMLTPEYQEAMRRRQEAEAKAMADGIAALARLLETVLTRTPEQKERARYRKLIRQNNREDKRLAREMGKHNKKVSNTNQLKIDSISLAEPHIQWNKNTIYWGASSLTFLTVGLSSKLIADNIYNSYLNNNSNTANKQHNQIKNYDLVSNAAFILSGLSAVEFVIQNQKNKRSLALKLIPDKKATSGVSFGLNYTF